MTASRSAWHARTLVAHNVRCDAAARGAGLTDTDPMILQGTPALRMRSAMLPISVAFVRPVALGVVRSGGTSSWSFESRCSDDGLVGCTNLAFVLYHTVGSR